MTYTFTKERSPRIVAALVDWRAYIDALPAGNEKDGEELVWSIWHSWVDEIAERGWDRNLSEGRDAKSWLYGIGKSGRSLGASYQELRKQSDALDIANRMRATGWPRCGEAADFLIECWRTGRYWGQNTDNSIFSRNHDDINSVANGFPVMDLVFDDAAETISWEFDHEMWGLIYHKVNITICSEVTQETYSRGQHVAVHDVTDRMIGSMSYADAGLTPAEGWGVSMRMSPDGGPRWAWGHFPKTPWGRRQKVGSTPIDPTETTIPTFTLRGEPFDPKGPKPGYRWDLYHFIRDKDAPYINALFKENRYADRFPVLNEASDLEWSVFVASGFAGSALESWLDPESKVDLDELRDTYTIVPMPDLVLRGQPLPMIYRTSLEDVPFSHRGRAARDNILPRLEYINALSDEDYAILQESEVFNDLFSPNWHTTPADMEEHIRCAIEVVKMEAERAAYEAEWEAKYGPANPGPGEVTRAMPDEWTGKGKVQLGGGGRAAHRSMFTNLRVTCDEVARTWTAAWDDRPPGPGWEFTVEWQPMAGDAWQPSDGGAIAPQWVRVGGDPVGYTELDILLRGEAIPPRYLVSIDGLDAEYISELCKENRYPERIAFLNSLSDDEYARFLGAVDDNTLHAMLDPSCAGWDDEDLRATVWHFIGEPASAPEIMAQDESPPPAVGAPVEAPPAAGGRATPAVQGAPPVGAAAAPAEEAGGVPDGYEIRVRQVDLIREGRHKYRISIQFVFGPSGAKKNDLDVASRIADRWAVSVPGFKTLDPSDIVMAGQDVRGDTVLLRPDIDSKDGFYVTNLWAERKDVAGIYTATIAAEKGDATVVSLDHEFAFVPIPNVGEDRIGTPDEYRKAMAQEPPAPAVSLAAGQAVEPHALRPGAPAAPEVPVGEAEALSETVDTAIDLAEAQLARHRDETGNKGAQAKMERLIRTLHGETDEVTLDEARTMAERAQQNGWSRASALWPLVVKALGG